MGLKELPYYWSESTGTIINIDLPGAEEEIRKYGNAFPAANQAAINLIDKLVRTIDTGSMRKTHADKKS